MRDSVMWFLVLSLVVTALFVVNARHQHRIAFLALQSEEARRDALNDEWGQLLVEENLWSFPHRVEKDAVKHLSMRAPEVADVELVSVTENGAGE